MEAQLPKQPTTQAPQSTPKKKHKIRKRKETIQIKIETINTTSDKSLPLIGYFPSGYDPEKRKRVEDEPRITVLKHVKRNNQLQVVVTPTQSSPVNFVGTNYSGEASAPQICSYGLGVLDKETGTLRIVQIEANNVLNIFRLEPRFGDEDNAEDEAFKMVESKATVEDVQSKYNFSTKKSDRTGKLIDIHYNAEGTISGACIQTLLQVSTPGQLDQEIGNLPMNCSAFCDTLLVADIK